jgi:hypothetical protein
MPILVVCPKCETKLSAPDSGAGKHVRCPKFGCGTLVPVPAFVPAEPVEVVDAEEVPRKPKPVMATAADDEASPRRKRRDEDDDDDRPRNKRREDDNRSRKRQRSEDDDDDDYDRPRRRQRKRAGMGAGVLAAIVLGSLLLLGGIGYGVYALLGGALAPKSAPPAGWKEYTYKDDNFKAYFPKEPQLLGTMQFGRGNNPFGGAGKPVGGGNLFGGGGNPFGGMPANIDEYMPEAVSTYLAGDMFGDHVSINVQVMRYPSKVPSQVRDGFGADMPREARNMAKDLGVEIKSVRWLGERATEMTMPNGVTRCTVVGKAVYIATISGAGGKRAKPEEEAGFFDNFQVLN